MHHFGAAGLSNGLVVLADEETRTYWDHITGEAFQGPLKGLQLDTWPIQLTTVEAALEEYPRITISFSNHQTLASRMARWIFHRYIHSNGRLPPFFVKTMSGKIDSRLDKMEQGLGVIVGKKAKFYPSASIQATVTDNWAGRVLCIERGKIDGVPRAVWSDNGEQPMQLLSRWYGFSFTFPGCDIYRN